VNRPIECSYGGGGSAYVLKAVPWNESESVSSHRYVALQEEFTYEGIRQPWSISHQKQRGVSL